MSVLPPAEQLIMLTAFVNISIHLPDFVYLYTV